MVSVSGTRTCLAFSRVLLLASVSMVLAACETDGAGPTAADAPKAAALSARPVTEPAKPESPKTRAAKPNEPAADAEPMTHARAARECWMRTEKGNPREDIDKRADVVNKCIDEKLRSAGTGPKT